METIYMRIRRLRESLGLSQEELAKRLGYTSRSTINKIEAGKIDIAQSKIESFAAALHTTPSYLMGWEEEESYYKNHEVAELAERLRTNPEMRMLFDATKDISKEAMQQTYDYVKFLRAKEKGDF